MTDREKKLAEIREAVKLYPQVEINLLETVDFLLSELQREQEENQKLREEREFYINKYKSAFARCDVALNECSQTASKLQSAQQEIKRLRREREKLVEGLRWYAEGWIDSRDEGHRAREILEEIGVNVE